MNRTPDDLAAPRRIDSSVASSLLARSSDWMWAADASGKHTYTNGAIRRILGYTEDEFLGFDDFIALLHPDDRPRVREVMGTAVEQKAGWEGVVLRFLRKDGSWRWLESHGTALFDENGSLTGFCGADRDITDRMQQERRLAESENLFRTTFEHAGVGIAHVGVDGRWLRFNEPLRKMVGYSSEELASLTFQDITHPDDLDSDLALAARLFAGEIDSYSLEKRYIRKDGIVVWAMLTGSVARDDSGAVRFAIAVVRDISERKRLEAVRQQAETDYRTLFDSSHDAILVVDDGKKIVNANARALEIYGYSREELIGRPIEEISANFEAGGREVVKLFAGMREVHFDTVHRRRDGTLVELRVTSALVTYGSRTAVLNTCRDVTEENRLARAVAENERLFRSIIEHGYDLIEIVDLEGHVRFMSGPVLQMLGYDPESLVGRTFGERVHPDDRPKVREAFLAISGSPGSRATVTCRTLNASGEWRWFEGTGVNMLHVDGVNGFVIIARDISERLELESRLEQARRVESLGRVAATVAHEFNNVLMGIQSVAEVLARKYRDDAGIARLAEQLKASVRRGRGIAGDILRFSNPTPPVRRRIDLAPWVEEIGRELQATIGDGYEVKSEAEAVSIEADPDQLHQLVVNLVLNGRDAMPDGGTITISAKTCCQGGSEEAVDISVRDSGPGVPADIRPRIFEPLFTTKRKGTGLGLALCQQVTVAHGGRMLVEDHPEGGALFRARFPLAPSAAERRSKPLLLLVEDDLPVGEALKLAMEETYDVEWIPRGAGVVERVRTGRPDLVLLDVHLPDADGRELHREMRRAGLTTPVVLMSGIVLVPPHELDPRTAFLSKPFETEELLQAARGLMNS